MITRACFVVLLALVAGCSNLEDLDRDRCGNGIVEPGEDCDSSDARCVSCGIRCEEGACAYPGAEGFVCGADDFCHAPAGTFKTPSELSAAVETFRVTDVDHDGIGDLMVQSPTALQVFRGNAEGVPTATSSILTPIARGAASYAYLDDDQTLDLLLPTDDGIAAYTSTYGDPSPYPFPSDVGSIGEPLWSHAVSDHVMAFIGLLPNATTLALVVFDVTQPGSEMQVASLCDATAAELQRANVEVFDLDITKVVNEELVREAHQLVAVTLEPDLPASPRICVLAIDDTGDGTYQITPVTLPPALVPGSRPVLAPLRGGLCPSLVMRVGLAIREFPGAATGGLSPCAFSPPVTLSMGPTFAPTPVGWMPLEPPLKGSTHALVTIGGVFTVSGLTLDKLYQSDRPLAIARAVDIDADGDVDLVASARDFSGADVEDLDILYRTPTADPLAPSTLLRYRYDTAGPVSFVELADLDGNSLPDVAFVQRRDREGMESTELAIAYATRDQLLPPVAVGSFPHVLAVVSAGMPDSNDPSSLIDDLIVLYDDADGQPQVTLLHGSTQRVLNAYFDPRVPEPMGRIQALFRAVVGGRFYSPAGTTAAGMDLFALAAVEDDTGVNPMTRSRTDAWISDNASGGVVEPIGPVAIPAVERCDLLKPQDAQHLFCLQNTQFVTVPRRDASLDVVIGVDVRGHGLTIEPSTLIGGSATIGEPWDTLAAKVPDPDRQLLRSLELVELDSGPRLIASFVGGGRAVVVCMVAPATGVPDACMDVAAEVSRSQGGAAYTCTDAAPARAAAHARFATTPPPARELIALCREASALKSTIFRLTEVAEGFAASPLLEIDPAQELRTGDVNGDGLDDLVTVDHAGAIPTFRSYVQCTSRDTTGCEGAP